MPFRWLTEEDHFNSCQLTLCSGQCENQLKSTAIPGYKMRDYMLGIAISIYWAASRKVSVIRDWWEPAVLPEVVDLPEGEASDQCEPSL